MGNFAKYVEMRLGQLRMVSSLWPAMNVLFRFAGIVMSMNAEKEAKSVPSAKPDINVLRVNITAITYIIELLIACCGSSWVMKNICTDSTRTYIIVVVVMSRKNINYYGT